VPRRRRAALRCESLTRALDYLPVKTEVHFAGLGELPPQTVPVEYKAPCPRR
jgi:hypothetical protein